MRKDNKGILNYADFHLFGIEIAFNDFKKYQKFIEDFLESEKKTLDKSYKESLLEFHQDDLKNLSKVAEDYYYKSGDIGVLFPHNFRASFLIQIISFLERELVLICENYENSENTKYSIKDLKGSNEIEKAKQFLERSCDVNFKNLEAEWQFILKVKRIRNKLIHYQGYVKKSEKDWKVFKDFNSKEKYFDFTPKGDLVEESKLIIKNRLLIDDLIYNVETFFSKLLTSELKY